MRIGEDCLFAHNVDIMSADSHQIHQNGKEINLSADVTIENHVWVAAHSTILKGVTIGSNSVVGCHSVVTKSIPSNSIGVGNPCKIVKNSVNWSAERNGLLK